MAYNGIHSKSINLENIIEYRIAHFFLSFSFHSFVISRTSLKRRQLSFSPIRCCSSSKYPAHDYYASCFTSHAICSGLQIKTETLKNYNYNLYSFEWNLKQEVTITMTKRPRSSSNRNRHISHLHSYFIHRKYNSYMSYGVSMCIFT